MIFFVLKNPTVLAGFEPANLGSKGQHATSRPPKPLWSYLTIHCSSYYYTVCLIMILPYWRYCPVTDVFGFTIQIFRSKHFRCTDFVTSLFVLSRGKFCYGFWIQTVPDFKFICFYHFLPFLRVLYLACVSLGTKQFWILRSRTIFICHKYFLNSSQAIHSKNIILYFMH
jgi:hypothetical protein